MLFRNRRRGYSAPDSTPAGRQSGEYSSKLIAAYHAIYLGAGETFEDTLRRLDDLCTWAQLDLIDRGYQLEMPSSNSPTFVHPTA